MPFPGLWSCCFKGNARVILGKLAVALTPPANAKQGVIFPTAFPVPLLFFRWMNFSFFLKNQMPLPLVLLFQQGPLMLLFSSPHAKQPLLTPAV